MDTISREQRSLLMSKIRGKNTKPEMAVRKLVHRMGFRFRLYGPGLPGKPDLVFSKRRKAIFVHGCFWHQHRECKYGKVPKSRPEYWLPKLRRNVERDGEVEALLRRSGWKVLVLWECEVKDLLSLEQRLDDFLAECGSTS